MDESLVDESDSSSQAQPDARPSMREWSPEVELLAAIFDRLNGVIQIQSEKNLRLKPWPAPKTARDVLRQRERRKTRERLTQIVEEARARGRAQAQDN